MKTRSSANWNTLGGTIDLLNINYIDFDGDYPEIGNNYEVKDKVKPKPKPKKKK
jgi:hypothetical protein